MKDYLIHACLWALQKLGYVHPVKRVFVTDMPPELAARARFWILKWDENRAVGGEHKRHQVYAQLIREFPDYPHHVIGLAIEALVAERRYV